MALFPLTTSCFEANLAATSRVRLSCYSFHGFCLRLFRKIPRDKLWWYVGAGLMVSLAGCCIAISSDDISRIFYFVHIAYNVVNRVFKIVCHAPLGAFCVVANHTVFDFVTRLGDTPSGSSLSITSTTGQICRVELSRQPRSEIELVGSLRACRRCVHFRLGCERYPVK